MPFMNTKEFQPTRPRSDEYLPSIAFLNCYFNELSKEHESRYRGRQSLDGALSQISSAGRVVDYPIAVPKIFSAVQAVAVENAFPYRFKADYWLKPHPQLCRDMGIVTTMCSDSTTADVTCGYAVQFRRDNTQQKYFFPSEGMYLQPKGISLLQSVGDYTVVDEHFCVLRAIESIENGFQVQKLDTVFSPPHYLL